MALTKKALAGQGHRYGLRRYLTARMIPLTCPPAKPYHSGTVYRTTEARRQAVAADAKCRCEGGGQ